MTEIHDVGKPGMTFTEESYLLAIWFVPMPDNIGDTILQVSRAKPGADWDIMVRSRIYLDDCLTVETQDRKRFMYATAPKETPEQSILDKINMQAQELASKFGTTYDRLIVKGGALKMLKLAKERKVPWLHFEELKVQ